jgi:hypothetical protein
MKTAVVNIGPRQAGRQRNGNAVFDCGYAGSEIKTALDRARRFAATHKIRSDPRFGNGTAGETIARALAALNPDRDLLVKARR